MRKPSSDPLPKEKGPNLFLLLMMITGYALLAYSVFNILVNPILGLGWSIAPEGSDEAIPQDWEGALFFLAVGIVWTLFWRFWAWKPVRRWIGKRKGRGWAIGLGLLGLFVLGIVLLERQDRAERQVQYGTGEIEAYVRERKAVVAVGNSTLEIGHFCVNGDSAGLVAPLEFSRILLPPGQHRLALVVAGDTVDATHLAIPEGKVPHLDYFAMFNPGGGISLALLNYTAAMTGNDFDPEYDCKDCWLVGTSFGDQTLAAGFHNARLTLPRSIDLGISMQEASMYKMVMVPREWEGQDEKIRRYAIWKLRKDEANGLLGDMTTTIFMGEEEVTEYIRGRLDRNIAQFESEDM